MIVLFADAWFEIQNSLSVYSKFVVGVSLTPELLGLDYINLLLFRILCF